MVLLVPRLRGSDGQCWSGGEFRRPILEDAAFLDHKTGQRLQPLRLGVHARQVMRLDLRLGAEDDPALDLGLGIVGGETEWVVDDLVIAGVGDLLQGYIGLRFGPPPAPRVIEPAGQDHPEILVQTGCQGCVLHSVQGFE